MCVLPTPVAARSKAWVCGPRLLVLRTRIPTRADVFFLVSIGYCHVEVSGTGRSLVNGSPSNVVCKSVIVKLWQGGGAGLLGAVVTWKILYLPAVYFKLNLEVFKDWRWFIVSRACPKSDVACRQKMWPACRRCGLQAEDVACMQNMWPAGRRYFMQAGDREFLTILLPKL
jgi:hypothetical protein